MVVVIVLLLRSIRSTDYSPKSVHRLAKLQVNTTTNVISVTQRVLDQFIDGMTSGATSPSDEVKSIISYPTILPQLHIIFLGISVFSVPFFDNLRRRPPPPGRIGGPFIPTV